MVNTMTRLMASQGLFLNKVPEILRARKEIRETEICSF